MLIPMVAAILQSTQYERLAEQCELRADLTRLTHEREFYREQAVIFRRLAKHRFAQPSGHRDKEADIEPREPLRS